MLGIFCNFFHLKLFTEEEKFLPLWQLREERNGTKGLPYVTEWPHDTLKHKPPITVSSLHKIYLLPILHYF